METGKVSVIQLPRSHNYVILRSKATKNPADIREPWFPNFFRETLYNYIR